MLRRLLIAWVRHALRLDQIALPWHRVMTSTIRDATNFAQNDLNYRNQLLGMSSTSSISNYFKRKVIDENTTADSTSPTKRLKVPSPVIPKSTSTPAKPGEFIFEISAPEFELERSDVPGREIRKKPDLDLLLFKPFLTNPCAKTLYKYLLTSLPWYKVRYNIPP